MKSHTYPSRIDAWLVVLLALSIVSLAIATAFALRTSREAAWICIGSLVFLVTLLGAILPCRYTLHEDHLLIRSGIWKQRIPYSEIVDARKTRNPLSAPALSLKRVQIDLKKGYRLVSPSDRDEFIDSLLKRAKATQNNSYSCEEK